MRNKTVRLFFACLFSCALVSCAFIQEESPPYIISVPECFIAEKAPYYYVAGIEFDFQNSSEKDIYGITVSCTVYDEEKKENPFIGTNVITVAFDGNIPAREKKRLIIALDPYIFVVPRKPYLVDYFYIAAIQYRDGSLWEDPYGVYHVSSYE
jgi:hypothetical protein